MKRDKKEETLQQSKLPFLQNVSKCTCTQCSVGIPEGEADVGQQGEPLQSGGFWTRLVRGEGGLWADNGSIFREKYHHPCFPGEHTVHQSCHILVALGGQM